MTKAVGKNSGLIRRALWTISLAGATATGAFGTSGVEAGNGTFQSGEFNFCVSVRFNASAAQLASIRTGFQNGSQILADATDDQHRFGTITIVNDSGAAQSAEYWVNQGGGRAYATQGKYGSRGEHVNLFFSDNFNANNGADGDAYTIAHEHAHHAYGVLDEYSGPAGAAENAPFPDTPTLNYSLMDNYFIRGGRAFGPSPRPYTLNEFSVPSNHDPDGDTWQTAINGVSDWETISSSRFPATAPSGLPVSAPPAGHVVDFVNGFGGLRVMLLIDRSGSMSVGQRLDFAKRAADQFIFFVDDGDGLGVSSFASSAATNLPLATANAAVRAAAGNAINGLFASGTTNIGGGLLTALGQLTSQTTRSCNEIIVLLSDGDHNTGTSPTTAIPQLQAAGVTVLSVAVGTGISTSGQATLQNIAASTGGRFFSVTDAFQLVGLFIRLASESIGNGLLTQAPTSIASGETIEFPVLIEAGTQNSTFAVTFQDSSDQVSLSLRSPSGSVLDGTSPGVAGNTGPNNALLRVASPEAGTWTIIVSAGAITGGVIEVLAFAEHEGVQLNVAVDDNTVSFPDPVVITASPLFQGQAVLGATVTGTVIRPDRSRRNVALLDDGVAPDTIPDDGIYAGRFDDYSEDGTYVFEISAQVIGGSVFPGEELLFASLTPPPPANSVLVPDFVRQANATAVVTNVPATIPGDLDNDGDVDRDDLSILLQDRNEPVAVSLCGTPCDLDNDGRITGRDARRLTLLCTRSRCATQ